MAEEFPDGRQVRRFFGGFVPWVLDDVRWDRVISGEHLDDYSGDPTVDMPFHTVIPVLAALVGPNDLRKAGVCGCTRSSARSAGRRCSRFWPPSSSGGSSSTRRPGDLFQVANEVSRRDLTPFFDQVYRGSAVFDYGVESVTSDRAR